jgi:hypothetical protein
LRPGVDARASVRDEDVGAGTHFLTWRTGSAGLPAKGMGSLLREKTCFRIGVDGLSGEGLGPDTHFLWWTTGSMGWSSINFKFEALFPKFLLGGRDSGSSIVSMVGPIIDGGFVATTFFAGGSGL